ncbi:MAG: GNAT family N-acetyltransferase [Hyphomicrobiales bacterium]|nr:GNAT family N-acetyltransferase [Hyphomicrobiales bacterium]
MDLDLAVTEKSYQAEAGIGVFAAPLRPLTTAEFELRILNDLADARETWLAFEKGAACTPFQSYQWMHAWQFAAGGRNAVSPLIVLGYRGDRLAFILPFAVEQWRGARRLVWLGHELADYNGPLFDLDTLRRLPADFAAAIVGRLRNLVPGIDYMYLAKQPESLRGLPNPFAGFRSVPFTCRAHSAVLGDNWQDFSLAHRSVRSLRRLGEKERKLARLGELAFQAVSSPIERRQLMLRLVAWKVAQLEARGERVAFADAAARRFLRELARVTSDDPRYRLYALKLDGRAVALAFCLVDHARLIYYLCAYEEGRAARYSPGLLLLVHIFKQAIGEGLEVFDFSNGDENYKAQWIDRSDAILVSFVPFTLRGRLAAGLDRIELEAVRRVKRHPRLRAVANRLLKSWWDFKRGFAAGSQAGDLERFENS